MRDEQPANPQQPDTLWRSVTNVVRRTEAALSPWVRRWWQPKVGAPDARSAAARAVSSGTALPGTTVSSAQRMLPLTLRVQRTPHALVDRFSQHVVERHAQVERIGRRYRRETAPAGSPPAALPLPGVSESRPAAQAAPDEMSLDELAATFQQPPEMAAGETTVQRAVDPTLGAMSPSPERFAEIQAARRAAQRRAGAEAQPAAAVQRTPAAETGGPNRSIAAEIEARIRAARAQRQAASGAPAAPSAPTSTTPIPSPTAMRPPFADSAAQAGDVTGDAPIQRSPAAQPQPSASMPEPAQEPSPLPDSVPAAVQRVSGSGDEQVQVPEALAQTPTVDPDGEGYSRAAAIAERIRQARVQREAAPPASPPPRPTLRTSTDPESPRFSRAAVIAERIRAAREQRIRGEAPVQRQVSSQPGNARYSRAAEIRERLEAQRARRRAQASGDAPSQAAGPDGPGAAQTPSDTQQGTVQQDTVQRDTVEQDTVEQDTVERDTVERDTVQQDTAGQDTVQRTPEEGVNRPAGEPPVEPPSGAPRSSDVPSDGPNFSIARAIEARLQAARAQRAAASGRAGAADAQAGTAPPSVQRSPQQRPLPSSSPDLPPDPPSNPAQGPAQEPPAASMTQAIRQRMEAMRAHQQGRATGDAGDATIQRQSATPPPQTLQAVPPAVESPTALPTSDAADVTPVTRPVIMREFRSGNIAPGAAPRARAFSRSQVLTPERKTGDFLADESKPPTSAPAPAPVQRTPVQRPAQGVMPGSTSQHTGEAAAAQTDAPDPAAAQPAQTDAAIQRTSHTQAAAADQPGQAATDARAVDAPVQRAVDEPEDAPAVHAPVHAEDGVGSIQREPAPPSTSPPESSAASEPVRDLDTGSRETSTGATPEVPGAQENNVDERVQRTAAEPREASDPSGARMEEAKPVEGAADSVQRQHEAVPGDAPLSSALASSASQVDAPQADTPQVDTPRLRAPGDQIARSEEAASSDSPLRARPVSPTGADAEGAASTPLDVRQQQTDEAAQRDVPADISSAAPSSAPSDVQRAAVDDVRSEAPSQSTPSAGLDAPAIQRRADVPATPTTEESAAPRTPGRDRGSGNPAQAAPDVQRSHAAAPSPEQPSPAPPRRPRADGAAALRVQRSPDTGASAGGRGADGQAARGQVAATGAEPKAAPGESSVERVQRAAAVPTDAPDPGTDEPSVLRGTGASESAPQGVQRAADDDAVRPVVEQGADREIDRDVDAQGVDQGGSQAAHLPEMPTVEQAGAAPVQRIQRQATGHDAPEGTLPTSADAVDAMPDAETDAGTSASGPATSTPVQRAAKPLDRGSSGNRVQRKPARDASTPMQATQAPDQASDARSGAVQRSVDDAQPASSASRASTPQVSAPRPSTQSPGEPALPPPAQAETAQAEVTAQAETTAPRGSETTIQRAQDEAVQRDTDGQTDAQPDRLQDDAPGGDAPQASAVQTNAVQENVVQENVVQDTAQRAAVQGDTAAQEPQQEPRAVQGEPPLSASPSSPSSPIEQHQPGDDRAIQREAVQREPDTRADRTAAQTMPQGDTDRSRSPVVEPRRGDAGDLPAASSPATIQRTPRVEPADDTPPAAARSGAGRGEAAIQRQRDGDMGGDTPTLAHAQPPPLVQRRLPGPILSRVSSPAVLPQAKAEAVATLSASSAPAGGVLGLFANADVTVGSAAPAVQRTVEPLPVAPAETSAPRRRSPAKQAMPLAAPRKATAQEGTVRQTSSKQGATVQRTAARDAVRRQPAAPSRVIQRDDDERDLDEEVREAEMPRVHDDAIDGVHSPAVDAEGAPGSGDSTGSSAESSGGSNTVADDEQVAEMGRQKGRPSADLDTLARALLPIIKRMLVIERERRPVR